jgi:multiple sugar transport system substrate-binding protein
VRRIALAALVLAAIALACAKPRPKPDAIVFWQPWPPSVVAPLVARFESENPALRVTVRQLPFASMGDSLAAALAAGTPPDLCVLGSSDMPHWLATGSLCDWSAGVADLRDSLRGWPLCTVGDALYGLPWLLDARALLYNPQLFTRAGLDPAQPPATWAQLRTAAARIQKLGHGVHGFGIASGDSLEAAAEFLSFAWGNGGELFSVGLDSARVDSPAVLEALEYYLSLRRGALVAGPDTLVSEFAAGRLGLLVGDAAARAAAHRGTPAARLALVPRPATDRGVHAAYADAVLLVSFTGAHRKEAALRLARSLVRHEGLGALAAAVGGLSPATAVTDTTALPAGATAEQVLTRQCAGARFAPAVAHWDSMRSAIGFEVGEALHGRKEPAVALADAGARLGELAGRR